MNPNHNRLPQITVIGDSDAAPPVLEAAEQVGVILARLGITVVTGGKEGVMEAASRGAFESGGLTVGIVPSGDFSEANRWCRVVVATGIAHARNVVTVLSGDVVISIGGSAGTLSELCFAWIHGKPILAYTGFGGWTDRIVEGEIDTRGTSEIIAVETISDLENEVKRCCRKLNLTLKD